MARLVLINGAPGSGKSTLARKYVDEHPLALALDIDVIRAMPSDEFWPAVRSERMLPLHDPTRGAWMSPMRNLGPAASEMARLVSGVTDDQLAAPTPCEGTSLADLIDHVSGLSQAFTAAAAKDLGPWTSQAPAADGARLGDDWRTCVPAQLRGLAEAWCDPDAWTGMTRAGGVDLPGDLAGTVALDELVIHGWDVARASGQRFDCDPEALDAALEFVSMMSTPGEEAGRAGLFGPAVDVPPDAPLLDRVIGLSGRDPSWRAA